tara:strand:+ start:1 stop:987 length:987 start_codon:yes stop_codon:yes gene_type:complete
MTILDDGNIGIGDETPANKLVVVGGSASDERSVKFKADNGEERFDFHMGASGNSSNLKMYDATATQKIHLSTDSDSYFIGGEVGIGTTAPEGELHIAANSGGGKPNLVIANHVADTEGGGLFFRKSRNTTVNSHTIVNDDDELGTIVWYASDGNSWERAASINANIDGTPGDGDVPGRLQFKTTADGASAPTTRMTILSGGNVGIGTASPDTKLEVNGSFAANGPSSTFVTMAEGDTSPDVSTGNIFKSHSTGVTIDQFDGGICGQIITIISGGATVFDVTSSELKGGTTNITTAAGDVTMWVCESPTVWHLLSWMDVSSDLSGAGGF